MDEDVTVPVGCGDVVEAVRVARVGQGVEIDDPSGEVGLLEDVADKVGADETGPAGDEEVGEHGGVVR